MMSFLAVLLGAGFPVCVRAQETTPDTRTERAAERVVRGVVFEDANGNGRRDQDERALEGLKVSAGGETVGTDARGRYSLPVVTDWGGAHYVWVVADVAKYETPFWREVPATGAQVDIGLVPRKKPFAARPRMVHLFDIGGGPARADKTDPELLYMLREIARLEPKPDLLVIAGDGQHAALRREILKQESPAAEVLHIFASSTGPADILADYRLFTQSFGPGACRCMLDGLTLVGRGERLVPAETTRSFRCGGLATPVGFRVDDFVGPQGELRFDRRIAGLKQYLHPIRPGPEATVAPGPLRVSLALADTGIGPDIPVKVEMAQIKDTGDRLELSEMTLPEYETLVFGSLTRMIEFKKPLVLGEGYYVCRFTAGRPGGATWSRNVSFVVPKDPPPPGEVGTPWVAPGGGDAHAGETRDTVVPPFYLAEVTNVGGRVLRGPLVVLPHSVLLRRELIQPELVTERDGWTMSGMKETTPPPAVTPAKTDAQGLRVFDEPFTWHEQGLFVLRGDHVALEAAAEAATAAAGGTAAPEDKPPRQFRFDFPAGAPPPGGATAHLAVGGEFLCVVDARGAAWGFARSAGAEIKNGKYDRKTAEGSLKWRADISPGCRQAVATELELFTGNECLEIVTGKTRWTLEKYVLRDRSVALDGKRVVVTGVTPGGAPARQMVLVADRETGKIIWERVLAEVDPRDKVETAPPTIARGAVIVGSADGILRSLLLEKGAESWNFRTARSVVPLSARPDGGPQTQQVAFGVPSTGRISSQAVVSDRFVFFAGADGRLYVLDRRKGSLEWTYAVGVPVVASCALSGNTLHLADWDGNLYRFVSLVSKKPQPRND